MHFFFEREKEGPIKELIEERERRYIIRFLLFVPHTTVKNDAYYYCRSYKRIDWRERRYIIIRFLSCRTNDTKDHDANVVDDDDDKNDFDDDFGRRKRGGGESAALGAGAFGRGGGRRWTTFFFFRVVDQ